MTDICACMTPAIVSFLSEETVSMGEGSPMLLHARQLIGKYNSSHSVQGLSGSIAKKFTAYYEICE